MKVYVPQEMLNVERKRLRVKSILLVSVFINICGLILIRLFLM